jgi:hypothetical protein
MSSNTQYAKILIGKKLKFNPFKTKTYHQGFPTQPKRLNNNTMTILHLKDDIHTIILKNRREANPKVYINSEN